MKKLVLMVGALLIVAVPALAGSGGKCSNDAQTCLNGWAKGKDKGWLGLKYDHAEGGATVVKEVQAGSPAAAAGFEVGDVVVAMNGASFADKEAVKKAKGEWKVGQSVSYTIKRAGAEKTMAVTLAAAPPDLYASMLGTHMLENHVAMTTASAASQEAGAKAVKENK